MAAERGRNGLDNCQPPLRQFRRRFVFLRFTHHWPHAIGDISTGNALNGGVGCAPAPRIPSQSAPNGGEEIDDLVERAARGDASEKPRAHASPYLYPPIFRSSSGTVTRLPTTRIGAKMATRTWRVREPATRRTYLGRYGLRPEHCAWTCQQTGEGGSERRFLGKRALTTNAPDRAWFQNSSSERPVYKPCA